MYFNYVLTTMTTFPLLFPLSSPIKIAYTFCLLPLLHILPYRRLFEYNNTFDKEYKFCTPSLHRFFPLSHIFVCLKYEQSFLNPLINLLKTKRRQLYLKTQFVPRSKHFHLGYKNQNVVWGRSRCLFSDKYKAHKYGVGRAYNC